MTSGRLVLAAVVGILAFTAAATSAPTVAPGAIYRMRPDLRLCPSPLCGGFWLSRVNRPTTACADGTARAWCYVARIDRAAVVRTQARSAGRNGSFLVSGRIAHGTAESRSLGRLIATGEWAAATSAAWRSAVYLVTDNGVRCVRAPCFSLRIATVNTARLTTASNLDLSGVVAPAALVQKAETAVRVGGLLVSGAFRREADGGRTVVATQFFLAVG
jgi:hypothetical protein